jgi:hypothetical protein
MILRKYQNIILNRISVEKKYVIQRNQVKGIYTNSAGESKYVYSYYQLLNPNDDAKKFFGETIFQNPATDP